MANKFKYTAFISYSHADKAIVEWLHRALEGYKIPKGLVGRETPKGRVPEKFKPFFRDRDDLSAATNLSASIKKAMGQSQFLIVVCSPEAAASEWVAKEINEFKKLRDQDHILCLIVAGDTSLKIQPFPEALWQGLTKIEKITFEPVAADARPTGDGKRLAKLKLISGLLGIELDSLIQRETKRRQVQVSILAGVFTLATVVLSVLLYVATEARREAEANRIEAEERQFQAEELVGFMLGDLRKNLAPIGNLEIMDAIAIQALGYYASIDPEKMTAEALSRRSEVLLMLGEIQNQRGNSEQAQSAFLEAFLTTEEMLARDPGNPERIFDHSQSVFWLAAVDLGQGNLSEAEKKFQLYAEFAKILAQKDPSNLDYIIEVGYAHSNLGTLYSRQGKYIEAEQEFQNQLLIFQQLAKNNPESVDFKYEVAQSLAWLSDSQLGLGKLQLAKEQRLKEFEIYQNLSALNPLDNNLKATLQVTRQRLGLINTFQGNQEEGLRILKSAITLGEELVSFDPENTKPAEDLTWLILDTLETQGLNINPGEKQKLIDRAKNLTEFLLEKNSANISWAMLNYRSQLLAARALYQAGKMTEGLEMAMLANENLVALWDRNSGNYNLLGAMGLAVFVLAEGHELNNQPENAIPALKNFIAMAEPHENRMTLRAQDFLARAWLRLGFVEKAEQKAFYLDNLGYRSPDYIKFKKRYLEN